MFSPIEEIKSRLDLVEFIQTYIRLQKAGLNYKAPCPFHGEKTPSFFVSPTKQIWHCFGCGKGGDIFKFVQEIEGHDFPEALRLLATRAGIVLKREDPRIRSEQNALYDINEEASRVFAYVLSKTPVALTYLSNRGVSAATISDFRIGLAPASWDFLVKALSAKRYQKELIEKAGLIIKSQDGSSWYDRFRSRIMFPIMDANSRIIGFGGRIIELKVGSQKPSDGASEAKYINTPQTPIYDKSNVLYAFDRSKQEIRAANAVILVEGYMDCVMSHQAGVKNTVAVSGTALTPPQLKTLRRICDTIICSFDTDAAGEGATRRSLSLASDFDFKRKVVQIPDGKDPADTVSENPQAWRDAVAAAQDVVPFYITKSFGEHDSRTPEGKKRISAMTLPFIAELVDEIEKAHWIREVSRRLDVPEQSVWKETARFAFGSRLVDATERDLELLEDSNASKTTGRREMLEERFLALLAAQSLEIRKKLLEAPHHIIFHRPLSQRVFDVLMADDVSETSDSELQEHISILAFRGEVLAQDVSDAQMELGLCRRSLELTSVKDRLAELGHAIEEKEKGGDHSAVLELLRQFKDTSNLLKTLS